MTAQAVGLSRYSFKVGETILNGRYRIKNILSENSGMANVYIVEDMTLKGMLMVVKQVINYHIYDSLRPDGTDAHALKLFEETQRRRQLEYNSHINEARVMSSISHVGIPRISQKMDDPSGNYSIVVMDFIEGKTVSEMLSKPMLDKDGKTVYTKQIEVPLTDSYGNPVIGPDNRALLQTIPARPRSVASKIPQIAAIRIAKQVCAILMYLHNPSVNRPYPIVYRDMKPANMRSTPGGRVFLLDYGTAKIIDDPNEKDYFPVGTAGFAPPEQKVKGGLFDTRYDLYSLGVTIYNMVTGVSPMSKDGSGKTYHKRGTAFSPRDLDASISVGLDGLVRKATDPNPANRFQSAEEMMEALENYSRFDRGYRTKLLRKVKIATSIFVAGGVIGLSSLIPFGLNVQEEGQRYNNAISIATQSGRLDDYVKAISLDPMKIGPYSGMLNSIKQDGTFTLEEEKKLLSIVNPSIDKIKRQQDYPDLAYEVGRLYWFYYSPDGEKIDASGKPLSTKWFYDAMNGGSTESELAKVYYNLGEFDKTISSAIQESSDAGKYREYWDNLLEAQGSENGEVVNLQINNTLASCIDNYSNRLKTDGVKKAEVQEQIQKLETFVMNNRPSAGVSKDLYDILTQKLSGLSDKVDIAYKGE